MSHDTIFVSRNKSESMRVACRSLSIASRAQRAATAAFTALSDPTRADAVATLGELTGPTTLLRMHERMAADPVGRRVLEQRPRVRTDTVLIDDLRALPATTFGGAYAAFLGRHGFDPDERDEVRDVADPELAYVMLRYRETHDFVHVLCGQPPTVAAEVAIKWFEMVQTGLPVATISALVGPLRLSPAEVRQLALRHVGWAARNGRRSRFMLNVMFEDHWEDDLEQLRGALDLERAPRWEGEAAEP